MRSAGLTLMLLLLLFRESDWGRHGGRHDVEGNEEVRGERASSGSKAHLLAL